MEGKIKKLIRDRGYGFIETTLDEDIFFHCSNLKNVDFDFLNEDTNVEFDIINTFKGLEATNIKIILNVA